MWKWKRSVILGVLTLLSGMLLPLFGHSDTPLKWKDGVLKGLPKEFRPAGFDFKKRELTLKGQKLAIPEVLKPIFTEEVWGQSDHGGDIIEWPPKGVTFSASWYHGPSELPPYLMISVAPRGVDYRYEIMVDMEKVEMREANTIHSYEDGKVQMPFPIDLTEQKDESFKETKWAGVIGKWRGPGMILEIKEDTMVIDEVWSDGIKVWKVLDSKKSNVTEVLLHDQTKETVSYWRNGNLLSLVSTRGLGGTLARFGSKADLDSQRRHENFEEDEE